MSKHLKENEWLLIISIYKKFEISSAMEIYLNWSKKILDLKDLKKE